MTLTTKCKVISILSTYMPFLELFYNMQKSFFALTIYYVIFQDFLCFIIFRLSNICKYDVDCRFFAIKKQLRRPNYLKLTKESWLHR